ncbi:NapC/NirT family cytochrome c [Ruegeria sp. HKCCD8929]|uniref:NapC/NirT family cytochrome c n=1 Tax=Ruegeria sp. HKCCD8929 TaxID=2683006 RepID=UPI001487CFB5|nr:NapC/NirT family cytochrome c [Ruegeria sp. HKCCD8929]
MPKSTYSRSLVSVSGIFLAGVLFWGGFNWSLEVTNTETFCTSCHAMRAYPFEEYKSSVHYSNPTGVRASCPDCHVPREWGAKVIRKIRATNELYHWARGSIDAPEDFHAKRLELAQHVWERMEKTDSHECRNCHEFTFMDTSAQQTKAGLLHELGTQWQMTCIDCHKGIAHSLPEEFDRNAVMDEIHVRLRSEDLECRLCHEGMAGPKPGDEW